MNHIQFSIIILASLFFAFQSCTKKPVEALAPETVERIAAAELQEVNFKFVFAPDNQEVWSDLIINEEGEWLHDANGRIYSNETAWMRAEWRPQANVLEYRFKYEVMGIPSVELWEAEECGDIEKEIVYKDGDLYVIHLEVDDDFVNCLDGTGEQIKMTARLKL